MGSIPPSDRTILVLGSGPGIGRSVASLFASRRYGNVVLIARRAEQLRVEKELLERVAGVAVGTYAVDLTDTKALLAVLDDADAVFGKPELVFYNAARVLPSAFFDHPVEDIEYDLKVCTSPGLKGRTGRSSNLLHRSPSARSTTSRPATSLTCRPLPSPTPRPVQDSLSPARRCRTTPSRSSLRSPWSRPPSATWCRACISPMPTGACT
jgi:hypothetical protein